MYLPSFQAIAPQLYRLKAMTHIDDSLAVLTSEFFGGPVSTDDRPIFTPEPLTGVDRMLFFFFFHYSNCFVNGILT